MHYFLTKVGRKNYKQDAQHCPGTEYPWEVSFRYSSQISPLVADSHQSVSGEKPHRQHCALVTMVTYGVCGRADKRDILTSQVGQDRTMHVSYILKILQNWYKISSWYKFEFLFDRFEGFWNSILKNGTLFNSTCYFDF